MDVELQENQGVRVAVEGCGHGTLHAIYASVAEACKQKDWPSVDLLIIGGDFQSVRNAYDLQCVSMPVKYREMCDFHEYYSGQRMAPYLTIFVGGNHEASNYLFELYYGGWVAPNIYYMGATNVLRIGPLRIAGMSGIWKGYNYRKPHVERLPYNESDVKSVYHVRELDVRKLQQIRTPVDIGISHDWPRGVEWKGNWKQLFRFKPHFEEDAKTGQLGNIAAQQVMDWLRPRYWFSAHLHAKFAALVAHKEDSPHSSQALTALNEQNRAEVALEGGPISQVIPGQSSKNVDEIDLDLDEDADLGAEPAQNGAETVSKNADEIDLDLEGESVPESQLPPPQASLNDPASAKLSLNDARAALPEAFRRPAAPAPAIEESAQHPPKITNKTTHFLALDKCLPARHFLQLLSIPSEADVETRRPLKLEYDREWLAIARSFAVNEPLVVGDPAAAVPRAKSQADYLAQIEEQVTFLDQRLNDDDLIIPENFEPIAPVYDGGNWNLPQYHQVREYPNSQTAKFCNMLQIPNPFELSEDECIRRMTKGPRPDPYGERFDKAGRGRGGRGGFGRGGPGGWNRGHGRGRGNRGRGGHRGH